MTKLDCSSARRLIHLQLDGELRTADARLLEQHLQDCESCNRVAAELQEIDAALREGLAAYPVPDQSIEDARHGVRRARLLRRLWSTWLPAAAVFTIVAVGLFALSRWGGPPQDAASAVVVSGGDAVHVFEPNQKVSSPGHTGTQLQEHAVAWGLSKEPVALQFANGAQVQISDEAVVRIGRDSLDLFKGDIRADLTQAPNGFTVTTPWGQFEAAEAVFVVRTDADGGNALLRVISGEVRVEQRGRVSTFEAGQQVTLRPDPHRTIAL